MAAPIVPKGAKSDKIWRDAIMRAVRRPESGKATKKEQRLEKLADMLVERGLEGDVSAMKEIGDRLDGKATQPIEHGGSALEEMLARLSG